MDESLIRNRRIVLIGGAGFIGHHLALALKKLGADVSVIDSLQVNNFSSIISDAKPNPHRELFLGMIDQRLSLFRSHGINLYTLDARQYNEHQVCRD